MIGSGSAGDGIRPSFDGDRGESEGFRGNPQDFHGIFDATVGFARGNPKESAVRICVVGIRHFTNCTAISVLFLLWKIRAFSYLS